MARLTVEDLPVGPDGRLPVAGLFVADGEVEDGVDISALHSVGGKETVPGSGKVALVAVDEAEVVPQQRIVGGFQDFEVTVFRVPDIA